MATWTRQSQTEEGEKHLFSGTVSVTELVHWDVELDDIHAITKDVKDFARESNGINKVQTYTDGEENTLLFVDHYPKGVVEAMTPEENEKKNWCTLRFEVDYSLGDDDIIYKG